MKLIRILALVSMTTFIFSCNNDVNPLNPNNRELSPLESEIPYDFLGSGKIVFERHGNYHEFKIIDLDEHNSWSINIGGSSSPCVSPGGDKIAFTHIDDNYSQNEERTAYDVYVVDINGDNLKQLTNHVSQERFPAWNRSGNLILYWNSPAIYSVRSDGHNAKIIRYDINRHPSGRLSISEDEKVIYVGNNEIFMMNIDGSGIETLIEGSEDQGLASPIFSPDSKSITYVSFIMNEDWKYKNMKIHLFEIDQGADKIIYESEIDSHSGASDLIWICWSPDGNKFLFTKPINENTTSIFAINVDGSELTCVTSFEGFNDISISWSR